MGFLIKCAICGEGFKDARAYTGTSGVVFPPPHHLYEYCDAGLHIDCLEKWEHRLEFSQGYYEQHKQNFESMGTLLHEGDGWILGCGPAPLNKNPFYAEIDLLDWPCRLYSNWEDWDIFLKSGYKKDLDLGALDRAHNVISLAREVAPNLSALTELRKNVLQKNA